MPGATTKGAPYSSGADAASTIDTTMQNLAVWVDGHLVQGFTTAARDAIAGADKWTGRLIFNTTTVQLEVWTGTLWQAAGSGGSARALMLMGG